MQFPENQSVKVKTDSLPDVNMRHGPQEMLVIRTFPRTVIHTLSNFINFSQDRVVFVFTQLSPEQDRV